MLDNEQQDGVTEETYLTVVRASSPSSASEQAGNLTVVAMIYWNMRYSDDLQIGYDIAFIKSGHVYRDAGSSGVYKLYGENYVAFGTYMDSNSNNWSNPTDNRTYTLTNNFSNTYTAAYMNNFTSTAITKVYANSHSPSTLSVSVSKNSKGCKNMLSKGGLSVRRDLIKKIAGIVLIAVLIVSFRLVRTLVSMRAPGALLPYLLAHYLLMGAGLALLGVAEQKRPAVEYGVAAGGAILFYLIVGLIQPVQSTQAYAPSPVGGMLIGLCTVQCALQIKRGRVRSDRPLTGALPLLGMMLLAGLSGVLIKGMAQNGKNFTILVQVTNWLPCLFLLPFLKRGEKWGWALAVLGLPLAVFLVIASQPGINQVLYAGEHNPLQVPHSHLAANTELLAALGIGGIYLLLPESRKT